MMRVNVEAKPARVNTDIVLDTEFNSRAGGFKIEPISFALVRLNLSASFYAVSAEFDQAKAQAHEFLAAHVLPKLPPMTERHSISAIRSGMLSFFETTARDTGANQVTLYARNGGMGDFILLDLLFEGRFFEEMNARGIERTYMKDSLDLYEQAGRPKLDQQIPIDPATHHTAIGDAEVEARRIVVYRGIIGGSAPG